MSDGREKHMCQEFNFCLDSTKTTKLHFLSAKEMVKTTRNEQTNSMTDYLVLVLKLYPNVHSSINSWAQNLVVSLKCECSAVSSKMWMRWQTKRDQNKQQIIFNLQPAFYKYDFDWLPNYIFYIINTNIFHTKRN